MTKFQLFRLLSQSGGHLTTVNGVTGILCCVEREDGSGRSFNVKMRTLESGVNLEQKCVMVHVRTID